MDIDAGQGVRILGHHPGKKRNALFEKQVGHPINGNCKKPWITKHYFVIALCCRVAFESRQDILGYGSASLWNFLKKVKSVLLPRVKAVGAQLSRASAFMPYGARDLKAQAGEKIIDYLPHVIGQYAPVNFLVAEKAGIYQFESKVDKKRYFLAGRDQGRIDVSNCRFLSAALNYRFNHLGKRLPMLSLKALGGLTNILLCR